MHLARYLKRHPTCDVGRPRWQLWGAAVVAAAAGGVGALAVALFALVAAAPTTALLAALVAFGCGAVSPRAWARFVPLWALTRQGRKCFAVSDESMILIDASGGAVEVALERIVALEIDGEEPRLRVDDGASQGMIYAALFDVFDEHGPSAEAFFEALELRLRSRIPQAQIVRHADLPLW